MNWKEVSEKCPKSLDLLIIYLMDGIIDEPKDIDGFIERKETHFEFLHTEFLTAHEDYPWNVRNLYDFFDENSLIIIVDYDFHDGDFLWKYDITFATGAMHESPSMYKTRIEAETSAFIKAFEILEFKL